MNTKIPQGTMKIWECKIGEVDVSLLPHGADLPMRHAVAAEFKALTGVEPKFIFSGWGAELTESERAVVENRLPKPSRDQRKAVPDDVKARILYDFREWNETTGALPKGGSWYAEVESMLLDAAQLAPTPPSSNVEPIPSSINISQDDLRMAEQEMEAEAKPDGDAVAHFIRDICEMEEPADDDERAVRVNLDWLEAKLRDVLFTHPSNNECHWQTEDDDNMPGTYKGSCGILWTFTEGGIEDNECKFCPRCGGKIISQTIAANGA